MQTTSKYIMLLSVPKECTLKAANVGPTVQSSIEHVAVVSELTGRRLHRELAALGYRGGYTAATELRREMGQSCRRPLTALRNAARPAEADFA